jgi:hypothetical protein
MIFCAQGIICKSHPKNAIAYRPLEMFLWRRRSTDKSKDKGGVNPKVINCGVTAVVNDLSTSTVTNDDKLPPNL